MDHRDILKLMVKKYRLIPLTILKDRLKRSRLAMVPMTETFMQREVMDQLIERVEQLQKEIEVYIEALEDITVNNMSPGGPAYGAIEIAKRALAKGEEIMRGEKI
jgi:hypothetical protein